MQLFAKATFLAVFQSERADKLLYKRIVKFKCNICMVWKCDMRPRQLAKYSPPVVNVSRYGPAASTFEEDRQRLRDARGRVQDGSSGTSGP